jgi:hemoglobin
MRRGRAKPAGRFHEVLEEQQIAELVDRFYGRVRQDDLLAPVFEAAIGEGWGPHLQRMKDFWSTVMLATMRYKGNPMMKHLLLPRLSASMFARWLELWRRTAGEICDPPAAAALIAKAEMIAERFLSAIDAYHGSQEAL